MENCQLILEITVNLPHDCGVLISQTPFVEPLGRIHVAGRRQGCGHRGRRLGAAAVVGQVAQSSSMAVQWRQWSGSSPMAATVMQYAAGGTAMGGGGSNEGGGDSGGEV